jgi:hypothetical protein
MVSKVENLNNLELESRYDYFIREVVQFKEVWTITTDEGYIIFKSSDEMEVFPVWPSKELADCCSFEEHKKMGAIPEKIDLYSFVMGCLPDMADEGISIGVFYDTDREGMLVNGKELSVEIGEEYFEIWGENIG